MSKTVYSHVCADAATFDRDYRNEGEPEEEFNPGIASRLPRKNVASGAIIRDQQDRILFVVPNYKPFLEIPGGLTEDNESPLAACRREIEEELGIFIAVTKLLLVDWMPAHGVWKDSVQFVFDGGILPPEEIERIRPADGELDNFEFLDLSEAARRLRRRWHDASTWRTQHLQTAYRGTASSAVWRPERGKLTLAAEASRVGVTRWQPNSDTCVLSKSATQAWKRFGLLEAAQS